MTANAWTLSLMVAAYGWSPSNLALFDSFTADLVAAMAHPNRPGCRCPRA